MEKHYRYPGAGSFTEADRDLFFGRDKEIRQLTELILIEKLVVLFGKSGYGKTSLLNAGVVPRLKESEAHTALNITLKEPESPEVSPLEQLLDQLKDYANEPSFVSEKLDVEAELPYDESAKLWFYAKQIQLAAKNSEAITLVFDHFEKLFDFRELQAKALGRSLANLLQQRPPKAIRRLVNEKMNSNPEHFKEEEIEELFKPLNVKVLISISHDHLASLDMLKSMLPAIFKYTFELQPLNEFQAVEVLEEPAKKEGQFASPAFTYTKAAINNILSSLKDKRTKRIETYQLQLIGQHAEEIIINRQKKTPELAKFQIGDKDLDKPELILEKHYEGIIKELPRLKRGKARRLVQNLLIINGSRVPLPERVLSGKYDIPVSLLDTLVDKRLLRSEPNSVGGVSFELSHDTLVPPILRTAKKRRRQRNYLISGLVFISAYNRLFYMGHKCRT